MSAAFPQRSSSIKNLECLLKDVKIVSICRDSDKGHNFISIMAISSPNPMFDHLLESSHRDDSNKRSNIGFGEEKTQVESIEINLTRRIWSSGLSASLMKRLFLGIFVLSIRIYTLIE